MTHPGRSRVEMLRENSSATTLELFFDLVLVFALTQITALMAADVSGTNVLRGMLVFAVIWWIWTGYAWFGNVVKADEGPVRVAIFAAIGVMFLIALAIPEAFADWAGGLWGPAVFAVGYLLMRTIHLLAFWAVSVKDAALRRQLVMFTPTCLVPTALLLVAAQTSGATQIGLWVAAVVFDYGWTLLIGAGGWRVNSARHFAERHGLIVIVAIGESVVAIGVGVADLPISWPIVLGATLGLSVAASMWWAYFDTAALLAERALGQARGAHRAALARTAYTYLHLPMVAGIILVALGLKKVLEYVGDEQHHTWSDTLSGVPLLAMYGGVVSYLLAHVGFAWRCFGTVKKHQLLVALLLLALVPLMANEPAILTLGVLAAILVGLNVFESLRFAASRDEIRHAEHEPAGAEGHSPE
ncbi:MAG: low temperature requirement protein A [Labedaea sp.]